MSDGWISKKKVRLMIVLFVGGIGGAWTIGPYIFAKDYPIAIDTREMRAAAKDACETMQKEVAAADTLAGKLDAADAMLVELRNVPQEVVDNDVPAALWMDDWETFLAARRAGSPIPEVDGVPVYRRMDDLVKDIKPCQLPEPLYPGRG